MVLRHDEVQRDLEGLVSGVSADRRPRYLVGLQLVLLQLGMREGTERRRRRRRRRQGLCGPPPQLLGG